MKEYPQFIKESWIGKFVDYTSTLPTPDIFKVWAGLSCIMGALERRVWIVAADTVAFPSHYILLVAPPGVGKSRIIDEVEDLWLSTGMLKVAPQSATKAAMVDALMAASRTCKIGNEMHIFHSLQIAAPEFGVLIPQYDNDAMSFYNIVWDCRNIYRENRRHGEHKETIIEYPQINMLAGTQPAFLGNILPPDAFGMGFTARLVMVYAGTSVKPRLFGERRDVSAIRGELQKDLKRICNMAGEMRYTPEAQEWLEEWNINGGDAPDHPRLETYGVRRIVTIQKLAMAVAAACSSALVVEKKHLEFTLSLMLHAENYMPDIFKGMSVPDTSNAMAELHTYMMVNVGKFKDKAVPEHMIIDWLKERVEIHKIDPIMKHMQSAGLMKEAPQTQEKGRFEFLPRRFIPLVK